MVEAGGGAAEMTVRELRDAFGVARRSARRPRRWPTRCRLQQYHLAARLGVQGRFLEARRAMLALGPFRSAPAGRSYSVRAAQGMLADARRVHARHPVRARALVRKAARIVPGLSSLPRVRALVGREV